MAKTSVAGMLMFPKWIQTQNAINPFIVRNGICEPWYTSGTLITDAVYHDYRLVVEYRFAGMPGNCGVLFHASTPRAL